MQWGELSGSAVQVLTAIALLIGLVGSAAALTRGERLRRRLKMHVEILSALPDGDDKTLVRQVVARDVHELHAMVFPNPQAVVRQRHEQYDWWIVPLFLVGSVGMLATTLGHEPRGWFAGVLLVVGAIAFVGLAWSGVRWRRARDNPNRVHGGLDDA